jgi:hyperosmotically inducible protein
MKNFILCLSLLALVACTTGKKAESTGEFVDSAAITTKVKTAFVRNSNISSIDIKVNTYKSTVQLSGFVDSAAQKLLAEKLAQEIEGVKEVKNDLIIRE